MFPGPFRAKLNSRSRRRASVFATTVVALHPSFLSLYPFLAYTLSSMMSGSRVLEGPTFLACVSLDRPCSQLSCNPMEHCNSATLAFGTNRNAGSIQDADCICASLSQGIEGKARLYRWVGKMSVTRLFFSPNKLIDYFPAFIRPRSPFNKLFNKVPTYPCQTVLYPSSHFHILRRKSPPLLQYAWSWNTARRIEEQTERAAFIQHCELIVALRENTVNIPLPAFGALSTLQLVYTVHACHIRTHSCAAASTYAHGLMYNVD